MAMLRHEVYALHIYRSRAPGGWQWAARLEHLPGGESRRFSDPEALLAYLHAVLRAVEPVGRMDGTPPGEHPLKEVTEEGGEREGE